jgi:hypothetical protein
MHLSSRQNKNRTYKNYDSKSIRKGKDTRDLRDYFRSSSEDSTHLSTPDRALPALLLLNRNLYEWRNIRRVCCV